MPERRGLGEFEMLTLAAVLRLREGAYGAAVFAELERTGRTTAMGAVYTTLTRLERRGLLTAEIGATDTGAGGATYEGLPTDRRGAGPAFGSDPAAGLSARRYLLGPGVGYVMTSQGAGPTPLLACQAWAARSSFERSKRDPNHRETYLGDRGRSVPGTDRGFRLRPEASGTIWLWRQVLLGLPPMGIALRSDGPLRCRDRNLRSR